MPTLRNTISGTVWDDVDGDGTLNDGVNIGLDGVTIVGNSASIAGGGIRIAPSTETRVHNTIIADNDSGFLGVDCYAELRSFVSEGHNLIGAFDDPATGCVTVPRLHSSFLFVPDVSRLRKYWPISKARSINNLKA